MRFWVAFVATLVAVVVVGVGESAAAPNTDPDLEPGFPVQALETAGSYHGGPAIHVQVGNIDADPRLEILATALSLGPLYAWNADGSTQPGWPLSTGGNAAYPAMGELSASDPGFEVFVAAWGGQFLAVNGAGSELPGWPRNESNYVDTPPSLGDVDGDGIDEIFTEEQDWSLHGYRANGTVLPGWPALCDGGQEMHTPAIGDLDGDGIPEIVSASGSTTPGVYLCAYHRDGTNVAGFPVLLNDNYGLVDTFPVIGDVDGDGAPEIVVVTSQGVKILSANGTVEHVMQPTGQIFYGSAPALGDLDGDGVPEIVVQTNDGLNVWKGDGTVFPGWPQSWSGRWQGNSAPVIGDVDGDGQPDIAVTTQVAGSSENGEVRLFDRHGVPNPHFPKALRLGFGGVPAIADVDLDGRNELVVMSDAWSGLQTMRDKVWVYDLHGSSYGGIDWGQFGGDPEHTNCYRCGPPPPPPAPRCVVPRVVGMRLPRARTRIRRAHCSVGQVKRRHARRAGRVLAQGPRAGTHLRAGAKVRLVVGRR